MNIKQQIEEAISLKHRIINDHKILQAIGQSIMAMTSCFEKGGKVLFCGNGGSAADAQHLAAELAGRFYFDRTALHSEALHVNTSFITAVANDYSFDYVYERMVCASGRKGDVLAGLSTSGNSANIVNALRAARDIGMTTIGFSGEEGGSIKDYCDILIKVPSKDTARIQEAHILIGHIICENVERILFKEGE